MIQVRKWAVGGVSLVSLVGCGDDDRPSVDAGTPPGDAGVMDASTPDGGFDAGTRPDSGAGTDAGGGTDAGSGTDGGGSTGDRAALEAAIRDACELFVSCYPDEYTVEDCIGYYEPYVDLALGMPGCAGPLASYFECLGTITCDAPDEACGTEADAAVAACPEIFETPPDA